MEKIITFDKLRYFAYSNDHLCKKPIRGIVLTFLGLGNKDMFTEDPERAIYYGERDILNLIPYIGPWSWMNKQAVDYVDELLDVIFEAYGLPEDFPVVSTGGSMGGLASLVYTRYAKRTPVACVSNCPVCDLVYHYTERPDLPRTLYRAFGMYPGTLEDAMKTASPLHLADQMPTSTNYYIFHCEEDKSVNLQMHSARFVEAMRPKHNISYYTVPERGHCQLTDEMRALYRGYAVEAIEKYHQK